MNVGEVKALGETLLSSKANVNNCSTLLGIVASSLGQPGRSECVAEAVRCLDLFFQPVLKADASIAEPGRKSSVTDAEAIYKTWLSDKYREFVELLIKTVARGSDLQTQKTALSTLLELVQAANFLGDAYRELCHSLIFTKEYNGKIADFLVRTKLKESEFRRLTFDYIGEIISHCQNGTLSEAKAKSRPVSQEFIVENIYAMLSKISLYMQELAKDHSENKKNMKEVKLAMADLWLSLLQLPLPLNLYKKILADMSKIIIPTTLNPLRLSDVLTKSYDMGGLISILALDGLFILLTKHGLEYPEFYDKLYALLEPSMFFTKYRKRFFELLDSCLKSPLLPAYLAAAFAKKLGRLSLSAPPSGSLLVIAMIHNLLRRHPSINSLIHQVSSAETSDGNSVPNGQLDGSVPAESPGRDPFNAKETKTANCNALSSSLWEVESLRRHYCPAVSRFVASLESDLTVRAKTREVEIGDYSSGSYSTIFHEETRRRLKQVPLAFYKVTPTTLFPINEDDDDFKGWTFRMPAGDFVAEKRMRLA